MRIWRDLLMGFLLGAVLILGYREVERSRQNLSVAFQEQRGAEPFLGALPASGVANITSDAPGNFDLNAQLSQGRQNAITRAIERVAPAVVGINVTQVREYRTRNPFWNDPFFRDLFPSRTYRQNIENLGSGFIISGDGYVLTNEHVVHNATEIIVTNTAGDKYNAYLVGVDYYSDIALLKIDAQNLPYLEPGNSDSLLIGEWVIALGNPFGLFSNNHQPSVTVGVISAINRDFDRTSEGRIYKDMMQTDASINPGNSGGPLVNSQGEVIGMATMIFTESGGSLGIGFAIPINRIKTIVQQLKKSGGVNRNYWTGLSIRNLDQTEALALGLKSAAGVLVTGIEPNSPGEMAGVQVADVIMEIDSQPVKSYNAVRSYLENQDLKVGDLLTLTILRDGKKNKLKLRLAEMPR